MDQKVTKEQIESFLSGKSDTEQAAIVASYLKTLNAEQLAEYLPDEDWQDFNSGETVDASVLEKMWDEISSGVLDKGKKSPIKKFFIIAGVAASLTLAIMLSNGYLGNNLSKLLGRNKADVTATVSTVFTMVRNLHQQPKDALLPDGTKVTLMKGAEVAYTGDFNANRQLELKGEARFTVVHDISRPFVIHTKGIITEDLGTCFWVISPEQSNKVTVRLLEGSVSVGSSDKGFVMKTRVLKPGQQIMIDKLRGTALVSEFGKEKPEPDKGNNESSLLAEQNSVNSVEWSNQSVRFFKTSLASTFKQLEKTYKVSIDTDSADIRDLQFTGTIYYSDSIETILQTICSMNDLRYQIQGNHIIIKTKL
jgi:ferric-dicitrate binding protein FerR (iron transport regulator)